MMVDKQERKGQNPWGNENVGVMLGSPKQSERCLNLEHTLALTPPSCSSSDHKTHEEMDAGWIDLGDKSTSDGGISPEFGWP